MIRGYIAASHACALVCGMSTVVTNCRRELVPRVGDVRARGSVANTMDQTRLDTQDEAIEQAIRVTDFGGLRGVRVSALRTAAIDDSTPFLSKSINGRDAWRVAFENVELSFRSSAIVDRYRRTFFVILAVETGQMLGITSSCGVSDPYMRPRPSAKVAEVQLAGDREVYLGLPSRAPEVRLLRALEAILTGGIGNPFDAKEIDAAYVSHSHLGSPGRDVWAITLRGLPMNVPYGLHADLAPVWQRNHMRNVIDARLGTVLFATNSPQPIVSGM